MHCVLLLFRWAKRKQTRQQATLYSAYPKMVTISFLRHLHCKLKYSYFSYNLTYNAGIIMHYNMLINLRYHGYRLEENYEIAEGVCIPRSTLYMHYLDFCEKNDSQPVNAASFGKVKTETFENAAINRFFHGNLFNTGFLSDYQTAVSPSYDAQTRNTWTIKVIKWINELIIV